MRKNMTLAAIASLVMASHRGSASEVVTFNFDNLLEIYLAYHGFVTASVFHEQNWAGYADVSVYHPHGMIPFSLEHDHSETVVFDQESYMAVVGKEGNLWRQLVLTLMRRRTCLFIGLSGKDINLDSILSDTRSVHASHSDNSAFWGVTFSTTDDPVMSGQWESRGVFYKVIKDYEKSLPEFLFGVCQDAARSASLV